MADDASVATDLPDDIKKIIALEVARIQAAQAPAAPKEETIAEAADRLVGMVAHYEHEDKTYPSGSGKTHAAIYDVLVLLVQAVFHPADVPQAGG